MQIISKDIDKDVRLWSIIKRLVRETGWRHAPKYALSFLLTAIVAGTTAGIALILEDVVNEIFVHKNMAALFGISLGVLAIFVIRGFATFGQAVLLTQITNEIIIELKVKLFGRVLSKEPSYVVGSNSAELMMIVNTGAKDATGLLNLIATRAIRDIFTLIALLIVMFIQNWVLAVAMLVTIPIIAAIISVINNHMRRISRRQLSVTNVLSNSIRGSVQGIKVVKAFGMENHLREQMTQNAQELRKLAYKAAVVQNRLAPIMELIGGVIIAGCIAIGGWRVIELGETPGQLVSFLFAALMIYDPARRLAQARPKVERHMVGIRLMYDFLDRRDDEVDPPHARDLALTSGAVRFEDVDFGYAADKPVLKGLDFEARPGQTTALVGRSGAGKTTVASLLLRFWRPNAGRITIDGEDLNDLTAESLRRNIAYVGQDAFMFDGTIRDNLLVGKTDASEAQIIEAARAAGAYDFIMEKPAGFNASVGELGANLSGGQKQRLAIARALLRDSPIVLLDEPTSALDGETERAIQASLKRLAAGRTTIVIAHRLSTIQHADQILVMDAGEVVERGRHIELISAGGPYSRLYSELEHEAPDGPAQQRAAAPAPQGAGEAEPNVDDLASDPRPAPA